MRGLLAVLVIVAGFGLPLPVYATTTSPDGKLDIGDTETFFAVHPKSTSSFTDDWLFELTSGATFFAASAAVVLPGAFAITSFTMTLFAEVGGAPSGGAIDSDTGGNLLDFTVASLSAGNYLIRVTGVPSGPFGGSYSGQIAAVPLPPAALLFLTALVGLALIGASGARRRRSG